MQAKEINPSSQNRFQSEENQKETDKGDSSHGLEEYNPQIGDARQEQNLESRKDGDLTESQIVIQELVNRLGQQQQDIARNQSRHSNLSTK